MPYHGTYAGQVVDRADPLRVGRLKVRVPILHGLIGGPAGLIEDEDLPWALPAGLAAGGAHESGGWSWIPEPNDQVWVRFLDGELAKPVWEWGNQNLPQAKAFGLDQVHQYRDDTGQPARRGALTRFQHWLEFRPSGIAAWTKSQYQFEINDGEQQGTGFLRWVTALGSFMSLDDSAKALTVKVPNAYYVVDNFNLMAASYTEVTTPVATLNFGSVMLGGDYQSFEIDAVTNTGKGLRMRLNNAGLEIADNLVISAARLYITNRALGYGANNFAQAPANSAFGIDGNRLLLGYGAGDPLVRLSDLVLALKSVKEHFDQHTHPGVGPPASPASYKAYGSSNLLAEGTSRQNKAVS